LELVCIYYRKQAGIEEEEQEVEVRAGAELGWHTLTLCCAKVGHYGRVWCGWGGVGWGGVGWGGVGWGGVGWGGVGWGGVGWGVVWLWA
jgi:hypothetical protein